MCPYLFCHFLILSFFHVFCFSAYYSLLPFYLLGPLVRSFPSGCNEHLPCCKCIQNRVKGGRQRVVPGALQLSCKLKPAQVYVSTSWERGYITAFGIQGTLGIRILRHQLPFCDHCMAQQRKAELEGLNIDVELPE